MLFHAASYDLPEHAQVTLSIYDILGEQIKTLVNQSQDAGNKIAVWNGTVTFPSGDWKMTSRHTQKWRKMAMVIRFMVIQSR